MKIKYTELQNYIENIMKEKQEVDKNERKKKNKLGELINENKELKTIISILRKKDNKTKFNLNEKMENEKELKKQNQELKKNIIQIDNENKKILYVIYPTFIQQRGCSNFTQVKQIQSSFLQKFCGALLSYIC